MPIKEMTSFYPYTLNTLVLKQMFWVYKCLDAILWGDGNETLQNVG
jgi:hypothetical protein